MADNKIVYKILVDDASGTATIRNLKGQIVSTQVPIKDLRKEFGNFAREVDKVRFDRFQKGIKSATTAKNQFSRASGGATSSVLELGRVVQDSNYGMRGMANNITQLASQMAFATKTAGSFGGALKDMGKAMLGPLGIVFAISVIVSIMERMEEKSNKAKKALNSLTDTFGEQSTKLMVLKSVLEDTNVSLESKTEIVNKANKEFKDLNITLDENGRISEETASKIDLLSLSFIKNAKARAIAKLIQDEMTAQAKIEAKEAGDNLKWYETAYYGLVYQIRGVGAGLTGAIKKDAENQKEALAESQKTVQKYIDMLKDEDGELAKFLFGGSKGKGSGKAKKRSEAEILEDLYGIDTSDEARKKYIDKLGEMFDFSDGDFDLTIAPKLNMELSDETQAGIDAYNKEVIRLMSQKFKAEDFAGYADTAKEALSSISSFIDAQFDRQLVKENNRTNAMNEELNNRLLNENISAKERASIQNEIARNDEKLRVKQNEIKKKAFNTNKAFQLSMAVADTAGAVLKAYSSQLIPGDPTSVVRAQIAASIAGAMGALQIATIASSKFQPDAASTPIRTASGGGGGGGVGNRTFDFNLVGNNQQNQLAEAIGGQFDRPLKAYVVSKDISNQQQLDANIKSSARFGG